MDGVRLDREVGLGAWLRERRERLGLSQRQLAIAAEIDPKRLERFEHDRHLGSTYSFLRLLDALGARPSALPVARAPRATNAEVHELRDDLARLAEAAEELLRNQAEMIARLDELEPRHAGVRARRARPATTRSGDGA